MRKLAVEATSTPRPVSAKAFDEVLHRIDAALVHDPDRLGSDYRDIDLATQEIDIVFVLHTETQREGKIG